ncbi:MAG: MlaD family protein [Puniceicoccales bacterium]|jgi:phospholipid/cholesterol/gamma-HCH transport system substrate-binding protein|nr:MlaD family protein [Puniceicoccales bacterium]
MKTKLSDSLRVFSFVLFGIILMYIVYTVLTKLSIHKHEGYYLKALFSDVRQLQVGDDVRVAGVRVGNVINTYLDKDLAVAVFHIEKRYRIPEDSVATILMAGLLGSNYVSITPGNSHALLKDDAYVKTQQTSDLSSVVQQFSKVGKKLDRILGSVEEGLVGGDEKENATSNPSLLKELGDFFRDNRPKLSKIIDHCQDITHQLAGGEGTLGKLLMEEQAYNDLLSMMDSIRVAAHKVDGLLSRFEDLADKITSGNGLLGKLIADEKTSQDFDCIVKNMREFCEKLNNDHSTLGRIIGDDALYRKAEEALSKVEKAGDSISNAGPVTAIGVAASALF